MSDLLGDLHRADGLNWLLAYVLPCVLAALPGSNEALSDVQTYHTSDGASPSISMMMIKMISAYIYLEGPHDVYFSDLTPSLSFAFFSPRD
jgi:hypothetical protein